MAVVCTQIAAQSSIEAALSSLLAIQSTVDHSALRARLLSLQEKLAGGHLHVAILGQMKRGKSSLANALLKTDLLPAGVLPVTAIITEIRYGETSGATIVYAGGGTRERIPVGSVEDYISEARNPGNRKQVATVEITCRSPFLKGGVVLIDTPGIGSTHSHNTETTRRYLGQVDAGIMVLSVDPPITEAESGFIKEIKDDIPKIFFVLNKTDVTSPGETTEILHFLEDELNRLEIASPEIFPLSARKDPDASDEAFGPQNQHGSGLEVFERRLHTFLVEEKRGVLIRSIAGDVLQIARTLRFAASVGVRAAAMSTPELEAKKQALDGLLEQADVELREWRTLIHQRTAEILTSVESDLTAQAAAAVPEMEKRLALFNTQHPRATGRTLGTLLEQFLLKEVEAIFRVWKTREDDRVQVQLNAFSSRFVSQANGILDRIEREASTLFEIPAEHLRIDCPLRAESHLRYRVETVFYSLDSFLLLLPGFLLHPLILHRASKHLSQLLDMNAGRIRVDYLERLQASVDCFEQNLRTAIGLVTDSLKAALETPSSSSEQRASTLKSLDAVIEDCTRLLQ